jgi:alkaline phosphatase
MLEKKRNYNVARNVIIFVGDGMGLPTITATRILRDQLQGYSGEEGYLSFDEFPDVGLIKVRMT